MAAVTVNPVWTSYCAKRLRTSSVGIATVVGFPLGATTAHAKVVEAKDAIQNGATEIDMVINLGALKSGFPDFVEREIRAVVQAAKGVPVKVILETCYLNREQKIAVCKMVAKEGAAFVKTSTGYGEGGATVEDVALLRDNVNMTVGVKASGGIRTYHDALRMVEAGATRLGTSASMAILAEIPS